RHIGVDAEGMVDAYLHEMKKQDETERSSGRAATPHARGMRPFRSGPAALVTALLVLLAIVLFAGVWYLRRARAEGHRGPAPASGEGSATIAPPTSGSSPATVVAPASPPQSPAPAGAPLPEPVAADRPAASPEAPRAGKATGELALIMLPTS